MPIPFIHLRLHTEFSFSDSLVRIKPLIKAVTDAGMPAVAVTDQANLCALVKFYKAAIAAGVKPLCGADIWLAPPHGEEGQPPSRLALLCLNNTGYRHLTELLSRAFLTNQRQDKAIVKWAWLQAHAAGLIALSGGQHGDIGQALAAGNDDLANQRLQTWLEVFPNRFYLELQRTGRPGDEAYVHKAVTLAAQYDCPVVATNDVMFLARTDFEAHEARVCIGEGTTLNDERRRRRYSEEQYFKSAQDMAALFADIPEALANTVAIAQRCTVDLPLGKSFLPAYPVPTGKTLEQFFRETAHAGLTERLTTVLAPLDRQDSAYAAKEKTYRARLDFELDTIVQMGFPGYFLIVMDFIRWAKNNGIPVGPGRGSGAGSLVAYAQKITELDPLQYDLLFERFLNPERVSMPDFDVDFCMDHRDRVIDYVAQTYGSQSVAQIITFGTMAAKVVVRDVARVQGKPYGLADKLAKLIPFELGITLAKAHDQEANLREFLAQDEQAAEIWEMALKLEGITRNAGKHAGGVVIAPTQLTDFTPLYCDQQGSNVVTQFDKDDVEAIGLVKFDFLGLRTLTIIDWAVKMINARRQQQSQAPLDITTIDLNDPTAYQLLKTGETTAVFQLESRGIQELIKRLQPDCFEDIIALVALFRPGPLQSGMVDNFINRKHGREQVAYPDPHYQHDSLKPILAATYGIILYQEQVMHIAQTLAGYSLGEADLLRRAMGKKKPDAMAKQRAVFEQGAKNKGIDGTLAMRIFDLVEKFAGYGFNKSHSAAYALVSYQTLWLKAHYPAEFMAAVLSADMQTTDKVVTLIDECQQRQLTVLPPDVNSGAYKFSVNDNGHIVYGLGAIKGVGEGPIENLVTARNQGGPFHDLFDFCARMDGRQLNKRTLDALIRAGAVDSLGPYPNDSEQLSTNRAVLAACQAQAVQAAEQAAHNLDSGYNDLFGALVPAGTQAVYAAYTNVTPWSDSLRLQGEKDTLGRYLTGHPMDAYRQEIRRFARQSIKELQPIRNTEQHLAGLVVALRVMKNKRGDKMAFITLDDGSGRIDVSVFGEVFSQCQALIYKDALLVVTGEVSHDDYADSLTVRANRLMSLTDARSRYGRKLVLQLSHDQIDSDFSQRLSQLLGDYAGSLPVQVDYRQAKAAASLALGKQWQVSPDEALLQSLCQWLGHDAAQVAY